MTERNTHILIISQNTMLEQLLKQHDCLGCRPRYNTCVQVEALQRHLQGEVAAVILEAPKQADAVMDVIAAHPVQVPVVVIGACEISGSLFDFRPYTITLKRPLVLAELFSALKRALEFQGKEIIELGKYRLYLRHLYMVYEGERIMLTDKEVAIITALYTAGSEAVSKQHLLEQVWGAVHPGIDTHTVETHIYRLRQKTKEKEPLILTTSKGYTLSL